MKIWDDFIRIYHWMQLMLIGACWWTAEIGELIWHQWLAMTLLALWGTRLVWGFAGSQTARFSSFLMGPKATLHFAKRLLSSNYTPSIGHDPLGAWMIIALLTVIGIQMTTGLFATDEIFVEGPLAQTVSADTSTLLTQWHHLNFNILLLLAGIHIGAVLIMQWRGHNLIKPMFNGKAEQKKSPHPPLAFRSTWWAWGLFALFWIALYGWFSSVL